VFEASLDVMLDPFVILGAVRDERGAVVDFVCGYANAAACSELARELIGSRLLEVFPEHGPSGLLGRLVGAVDNGEPLVVDDFEYEGVLDGERVSRVFSVRANKLGDGLAYTWRDISKAHAARAKLRLQARLLDEVDAAVISTDGDLRIITWNKGAERLLGWTASEAIGKTTFELLMPWATIEDSPDIAAVRALIASASGESVEFEHDLARKDGTRIPVLGRVAPFDRDGSTGFLGVSVDISERRRAAESNQRLAAIVECSQYAITGVDRDRVINVWNPGAERLYGYTASEAIGQSIGLIQSPAHRARGEAVLGRALAGELIENHQTERVCKDGSVVSISASVSPLRDTDGRVVGASGIARDMTSEIRAREQFTLQAELLDEVDAAVIFSDLEGVVRYWSRGAQRLLGHTAEEIVGRGLVEMMIAEESRAEMLRVRSNALVGQPVEGETHVYDKQGRAIPIYYRIRPVPLRGEHGAIRGTISIGVDISKRREAEATARRNAEGQQEIANLGRFALRGGTLEDLFDRAVHIASRALSGDCADLAECVPGAPGFVMRAAVGWPDERNGQQIAGDARSGPAYVVSSGEAIIVEDWEQEQRFVPSGKMLERGVRSSVAVLVGELDSPFGVLAVHYTKPVAVPPDCLSFLDALATVLTDAIRSRDAQETIRHQALHDGLTGLPNRTLFLDRVTHALARDDRPAEPLAVLCVDLDHFKLVNDSLGHEAGDELLRLVAPRLASAIRPSDTLARLGGDEFAVLCEQLPSDVTVTRIANRLMSALRKPIVFDGDVHVVSASIGIALGDGSSASELLRDADAAMHRAKTAGRGRAELFDNEVRARVLDRVRTEAALRAALEEDEIHVAYQPLVSLRSGQIVGAEALARWRQPDRGPVSPAEFITVAEDSGLIHQLGAQVMHRAAHECAAWQEDPDFSGIAVNVSIRQLVEPDEVPRLVRQAIAAEGITPGFLTLEITESVLIEQLHVARNALESLDDLGVRLSLDDFGTGYSSLSYLADLPFNSIKIDRSLIENIAETPQAYALAAAIIQMGHALDKQVIAEGVETLEQATRLQALGCDIAQGFYFAKPMAPDTLTALLQDRPDWLLH
jgi:diguanylate cyclase (GGDEF)-like protein/PAS domain S-box-containing protein